MVQRQSILEQAFAPMPGEEDPIKEVLSKKHLKMMSEIPPSLIIHLSAAFTIAKLTKCKVLENFCSEILELQISKDRKGRIEYIEGVMAARRRDDDL